MIQLNTPSMDRRQYFTSLGLLFAYGQSGLGCKSFVFVYCCWFLSLKLVKLRTIQFVVMARNLLFVVN